MQRGCGWCGNPGHDEEHCDIKRRDSRKMPYGKVKPATPRAISDPAMRDVTEHTMFLNPVREP